MDGWELLFYMTYSMDARGSSYLVTFLVVDQLNPAKLSIKGQTLYIIEQDK